MNKLLFKKIINAIAKTRPAWLPGVLVSMMLFIYALVANMSLSYMGNTSKEVMDIILSNYKLLITISFIKILAAYIVIGIAISSAVYLVLLYFFGKKQSPKTLASVNILITFFLFFLQFCKHCIQYPQLYIDTFYNKNAAFHSFQELLTNNVSPGLFTFIQALFLVVFAVVLLLHILKKAVSRFHLLFNSLQFEFSPGMRKPAIAISLLSLFMVMMFFLPRGQSNVPRKPNVIILASDALRPDHFSGFGYNRPTTPAIDRLISNGTSIDGVYTTVPRTFPSWVSILTSQYPATHGIGHMFPTWESRQKQRVTLAQVLSDEGYHTSLFGDFAADIFPRIDLGFDRVHAPTFNARIMIQQAILKNHLFLIPFLTGKTGRMLFPCIKEYAEFADPGIVTRNIIDEIDTRKRKGNPFFITAFYSVTHFPYPGPYPYYKKFTSKSYAGPYKYSKQRMISLDTRSAGNTSTSREDIEHIRALYDGCILAFDDAVGSIVQHLEAKGILDNTIILITSDHGENLYEKDYGMGHGEHLRGAYSLKIPCIFHGPGVPGNRQISRIHSSIDIAPTICHLTDTPIPDDFHGISLMPGIVHETSGITKNHNAAQRINAYTETGIWFDNRSHHFFQKQRIMYPEITGIATIDLKNNHEIVITPYYDRMVEIAKHRSIIYNHYKLIYIPTTSGIEYELYNLNSENPDLDISASAPRLVTYMKTRLFDFLRTSGRYEIINDYVFPNSSVLPKFTKKKPR
ncbi:MAG: sulfatase [Spirochaetota bacterium]